MTTLRPVAHIGGSVRAIAVQEPFLYAANEKLTVLEPGAAGGAAERGSVTLPQQAQALVCAGQYAYIMTNRAQLVVVDIADPDTPFIVSTFSLPGFGRSIAVDGDHAYLVTSKDGSGHDLIVVDVSDPARPALVHQVTYNSNPTGSLYQRIVVTDDRLYLNQNTTLVVFDRTSPEAPRLLGTYTTPDRGIQDIAVVDRHVLLEMGDGLEIVDFSDVAAPITVGSSPYSATVNELEFQLALVGQHALLPNTEGGMRVVDISDLTAPVEVAKLDPPENATTQLFAASAQRVYMGRFDGVRVVDVTNPAAPVPGLR